MLITSLTNFAFGSETTINSMSYSSLLWFLDIMIGAGAVVVLLLYTQQIKMPRQFSKLPVYQFFTLSILAVCLILAVSFFPTDLFGTDIPISTMKFINTENKTEWVFNIGGIAENQKNSLGIQIPIYVIIAGILGAYIRYLYDGIKEFQDLFQEKLTKFEEQFSEYGNTIFAYSRFTGREFTKLEDEIKYKDESASLPPRALAEYSRYKNSFFQEIQNTRSKLEKERFTVSFEVTHHTLRTVGFFSLAPLLAVLAWLLLLIGGTNSEATFALVSFSVGLTTNAIVDRIRSFVEQKISGTTGSNGKPPNISDGKSPSDAGKDGESVQPTSPHEATKPVVPAKKTEAVKEDNPQKNDKT